MRCGLVLLLSCAFLMGLCPASEKGGKERKKAEKRERAELSSLQFVLDHSAELKLSPEQIQKLETIQGVEEKALADPAVAAIMDRGREARKSGDERALAAQRQRLADKIKERTNGQFGLPADEMRKILTPEQFNAYTEMRNPKGASKDMKLPDKANPFEL